MSEQYSMEVLTVKIKELEEEKKNIIAYLQSKIKSSDWHAVADAAMDLREIDAKLSVL